MTSDAVLTSLRALPPAVGDAPAAAALLRDLAAALASGVHGDIRTEQVDADDSGHFHLAPAAPQPRLSAGSAAVLAPERFDGSAPDTASDVYAAASVALARYLGEAPVRAHASTVASYRRAQRYVPARFGAFPAPFRAVFVAALAKEPYLRPGPDRLLAALDAAFALTGEDALSDARARVRRLVVMSRAFVPIAGAGYSAGAAERPDDHGPRPIGAWSRRGRVALITAVLLLGGGAVAGAAVVVTGNDTPPVAQPAVVATTPSASAASSTASGSAAPPTSSVPTPTPPPAAVVVTTPAPVAPAAPRTTRAAPRTTAPVARTTAPTRKPATSKPPTTSTGTPAPVVTSAPPGTRTAPPPPTD